MDVDRVGVDFATHLNDQVAACDVMLVVIGPNWLRAKDKAGQRRLHQPDDFVAIEIMAALTRNIRVIPVLIEGARMPQASELPDALKPLARRQAAEIRHASFGRDAEALVVRMREAFGDKALIGGGREARGDRAFGPHRWRVRAALAAALALLLFGAGGYSFLPYFVERGVHQAELRWEEAAAEAEAKRKAEEVEQQRLAAAKVE